MPTIEIMTVSDAAPPDVLDRLLSAAEEALQDAGAERVWIERAPLSLRVIADLPQHCP